MRRFFPLLLAIAPLVLFLHSCKTAERGSLFTQGDTIPIVISSNADSLEIFAAGELMQYLNGIYPERSFPVLREMPEGSPAVLLGSVKTFPEIGQFVNKKDLQKADSFVVTKKKEKGRTIGVIAGADPRGALYGVYALLEEMGFGFYLSYKTTPYPQKNAFDLTAWDVKDEPVVEERLALNWHNFTSGCSSWNLDDWQAWISHLAKMRFNAVMVHAYGNNPIELFEHNGVVKPNGFLTTTKRGRDWGTQHVNDVRRLIGGDVFNGPEFGSSAALVPEEKRSASAIGLMQQVFQYADRYGMDVVFALDVDTASSNPQSIIRTIPEGARLTVHGQQVANPDVPEGYAYYESRLRDLMKYYPQVDSIALWFRRPQSTGLGTIWRAIKVEEFPADWKNEYQQILSEHPEAVGDPESPSLFAIAKIAQAYRKALNAIGKNDVSLCAGSWGFDFLSAAHVFLPKDIKLIPLDYNVNLVDEETTRKATAVAAVRPVAPIVWAHHDDRTYMGRPYTPFPNFGSYLKNYKFTCLGIIHWTTRPLDLYFKNASKQVWTRSLNEPIHKTCLDAAQRSFGPKFRNAMGGYLNRWIQEAPMFGRETTDTFIDRPLENVEAAVAGCMQRRAALSDVDPYTMTADARERFDYYKLLEEFCAQFYQSQDALDRCKAYFKKSQLSQLYEAMEKCKPEETVEKYAQLIRKGGATTGEKGLLVSLNLRWLPYFIGFRQSMREESIRVNFQPTQHDALAQAPGRYTFFIDKNRKWWTGRGRRETGFETFELDAPPAASSEALQEIGQTGVLISRKSQIQLTPFASDGIASGDYQVHLFFVEPEFQKVGQRVFQLTMWEDSKETTRLVPFMKERIDVLQRAGERNRVVQVSYPIDMQNGRLVVEITPIKNDALLCGAILEPVELQQRQIY